ncbi:Assembly factor cbp4 [Recurvomyces mirabilis]|uniref:Cytochrome b mRNA-processing protein 4 n=1 Tax=Recurvomyces mirabilis TaxID=574656 RepID=A0AAE0TPN7_9PEZI|nr:Assembly factor cbp4 [Recurvomyces mirabilis]KAK5153510.1 Assembly factor cbp4 [Recurvomyces mirabilis]
MCIGGPALIYYVTPTEEELFLRYNPELQRRSLERRKEKQEDFDNFVNKLKEYSKSDKPVWTVWEEEAEKRRQLGITAELDRRRATAAEAEKLKEEMKNSLR